LRRQLQQQAQEEGGQYLWDKLKQVDPKAAAKLSANDTRRIIRALEVYRLSGESISVQQQNTHGVWGKYPVKIFGLTAPRQLIYQRINKRADEMFAAGALEEASSLLKMPLSLTASKIIALGEIKSYLEGKISWPEAKRLIKRNTRRFAKRQLTWFKAEKRAAWINIAQQQPENIVESIQASLK
jgi:tRNA dimethylallyltransferase